MNRIIKKIFIIMAVCLMSIWMLATTSNAASFKASISETTVEVGDTLTVTINLDNAAGMYDVKVSDTSILEVTSGETSEFLDNESTTIKFKAKKVGTATITATPTDVIDNDNSENQITKGGETFTVKVVEIPKEDNGDKEENKEEDKNTNTDKNNNTTTDKETNKDNNKNTTATVTKSKDAKIKSITAQTSTQNLSVKKSSSKYTTTVAADVNKVTFTVVANSSKATIDSNQTTSGVKLSLNSSSDGKKVYTLSDLKEGGNSVVKITIKAENGNTESYNFVVTRKVAEKTEEIIPNVIDENKEDKEEESEDKKEEEEKEDKEEVTLGLKSLVLTGIELSPSFSEDVFEYTAEIINSSSVEVIATPTIEDATVEVVGNEDMVEGENVISILVKSKDEKDVKTYQVLVNKKNETVEAVAGVVDDEEEEEKKGVKLSTEQIIIIVVAVIIGIGVIIGLIVMAKKREEDDYFDWGQDDKNDKKKGKRSK